jgi:hypothetical protein
MNGGWSLDTDWSRIFTEHRSSSRKASNSGLCFVESLIVKRVQRGLPLLDLTILSMRSLVGMLNPPFPSTTWKIQSSKPDVLKIIASPGCALIARTIKIARMNLIFLQSLD